MIYRILTVTIQQAKHFEYWRWAKDVLDVWQDYGVKIMAAFQATGPAGEDLGIFITEHESEEEARSRFREIYGVGRGKELAEMSPSLIAETKTQFAKPWDEWRRHK